MAKRKIVWSAQAKNNRIQILEYWIERNKSREYSIKLNKLFKEAAVFIADFPTVGKPTDEQNVRVKIVRDYWIVYEYSKTHVNILVIFDSRRNPVKLKY